MNNPIPTTRRSPTKLALTVLFAAAAVATAALAAPGATGIDASGSTRTERVACTTGMTQQDQATCLKEATNAAADKRSGQLDNHGGNFGANALARCDVLQGVDKVACQSRVVGYGERSGSVAGGGVVTTTEAVVVPAGEPVVTIENQKTNGPLLVIPAPTPAQ